jgi:hypothetical protein
MATLADVARSLGHERIDVLKMDIEGAEWAVLENIFAEGSVWIGQILVEFHDRFFPDGKARTVKAIQTLKGHGFELFAVSRTGGELSFMNSKLLESACRGSKSTADKHLDGLAVIEPQGS